MPSITPLDKNSMPLCRYYWVFFEQPFVKLVLEKKTALLFIIAFVDAEGLGFATFSTISSVGR